MFFFVLVLYLRIEHSMLAKYIQLSPSNIWDKNRDKVISKFIVLLRWCNILSGLLSPFTSWVFWFCIVLIVFWHFFGGMMFLKRFLMSIWSVFKLAVSWRLQMYVEQQFNQSIIGSKQNQTERSQHWTVASPRFTPVNLHLPTQPLASKAISVSHTSRKMMAHNINVGVSRIARPARICISGFFSFTSFHFFTTERFWARQPGWSVL